MNPLANKRVKITFILSFCVFISIIVGFIVPSLESEGKIFMGLLILPTMIICSYIIIKEIVSPPKLIQINNQKPSEETQIVLKLKERNYSFSKSSVLIFFIIGPSFSILLSLFLELGINNWRREITAKQVSYLLKILFQINSQPILVHGVPSTWKILIPSTGQNFYITHWCTAGHIISIFIGIICCVPPSSDFTARKDINTRKIKALIILIFITHFGNLVRMLSIISLATVGESWQFIHLILNYISGILIALIFIIVLYRWLPETFLSVYFIYYIIKQKKKIRK